MSQLNFSRFIPLKVHLPYAVTLNKAISVNVGTKVGAMRSMVRFRTRGSDFSILLGRTQFPIQWARVIHSPGVKQPGRDIKYSPPFSADVKNDRNYASSSPFALVAWTCDVVTRKTALC